MDVCLLVVVEAASAVACSWWNLVCETVEKYSGARNSGCSIHSGKGDDSSDE